LDMLNLVYIHHLIGEAVSEQALRDVLGRKELPKWYTYINYLQDSNLITMTEDEDYVLKMDLSKMTLWDFYRTLPYPLPIKDELDEMSLEDQKPWLNSLVSRFENTEAYAKAQLNVPLGAIFAHSEPRKKSAHNKLTDDKNVNAQNISSQSDNFQHERNKFFRKSSTATSPHLSQGAADNNEEIPKFEPVAYDKDSDIECDEHNREILIPQDSDVDKNKVDAHYFSAKGDIITEADNPSSN
ncbi:MAG TPA: hypothetical protein VLN09_02205, partial [Psychrobacter sp.]|nr:hypothetical protein [Psychrobacter sp.]